MRDGPALAPETAVDFKSEGEDPLRSPSEVPPFTDFVARRFAVPGPFWSWLIFERLGGALAFGFACFGVSPTVATLLGGAAGSAGAILLALAPTPGGVVGALALLLFAYALDCSDGQLARATRRASAFGAWLDVTVDSVVVVVMAVSVTYALLAGTSPLVGLMLGAAFGAARTANLFTASMVRREKGGIGLSGLAGRCRTAYLALIDTPFVYAALCAARLSPILLQTVVLGVTVLTVVQTLLSARHHFTSTLRKAEPAAPSDPAPSTKRFSC